MILFIDDEPDLVEPVARTLAAAGFGLDRISSIGALDSHLAKNEPPPELIILDVMFPGQNELPRHLTENGLRAGLPLFASLRSHFPHTHIVVYTALPPGELRHFFKGQTNCTLLSKREDSLAIANLMIGLANKRSRALSAQLNSHLAGKKQAKKFELLIRDIFEFLFVPPMDKVILQSRRSDNHEIRDIVMTNNASGFLWDRLRVEFDARYVVVEVKNYCDPVGKAEVDQLRLYLMRKSIGRFGLLVSRLPPSESAVKSQIDAYTGREDTLILFLSDIELLRMLEMRERGEDPSDEIRRIKEEFELNY